MHDLGVPTHDLLTCTSVKSGSQQIPVDPTNKRARKQITGAPASSRYLPTPLAAAVSRAGPRLRKHAKLTPLPWQIEESPLGSENADGDSRRSSLSLHA
jgi:hypothetical protein